MVKYCDYALTFSEVPDEISLSIQISNCQNRCQGCHSPWLRDDIGDNLFEDLPRLIDKYKEQITCICLLGEGNDARGLQQCIDLIKHSDLKVCVYSGRDIDYIPYKNLDYFKVGSYQESKGPLDKKSTNQIMFKIDYKPILTDITYKFWPKETI